MVHGNWTGGHEYTHLEHSKSNAGNDKFYVYFRIAASIYKAQGLCGLVGMYI